MNMFIPLASSEFIEFTICPPLIHPGRLRLAKLGGLATAVMGKASVVVGGGGWSVGERRGGRLLGMAIVTMGVASPTEINACSPGPLHQKRINNQKVKESFRSVGKGKREQTEIAFSVPLSCSGAHSQQARCRDRLCGGVVGKCYH